MEQSNAPALAAFLLTLAVASLFVWVRIIQRRRHGLPIVAYELHAIVPWSGWDVLIVGLLALFLDYTARVFASEFNAAAPDELSPVAVASFAASRMIWMACALVFLAERVDAKGNDLGVVSGKVAGDLRLAVELLLAALLPVFGTLTALTAGLGWESKHPLTTLVIEQPSVGVLVLATLVAVVVAPLSEELFFRLLLQGWLEKVEVRRRLRSTADAEADVAPATPGFGPMIASSLLFALLHAGHGPDPIPLFILGLFLGYAYRQTHRLFAPVAIHVLFNALTMLQLWVAFLAGG